MMITDVIYLGLIAAGGIIGAIQFRRCNLPFRLVTVFLFITFIKETITTLRSYQGQNNSFLHNIYTPLHVGFFVAIYYSLISDNKSRYAVLYSGSTVFIIVVLGILTSAMNELPWLFISLDSLMLVIFSILFFYRTMQNPVTENIIASGSVWLNTSVLFYFTATFVFWILYRYIVEKSEETVNLLFFTLDQLGSVHYFLILVAMYLHIREQKRNVPTEN